MNDRPANNPWPWVTGFGFLFLLLLIMLLGVFRPAAIDATITWLGVFGLVMLWTVGGLVTLAVLVLGSLAAYAMYNRTMRQQDGHFALRTVRLGRGLSATIDINSMPGFGYIVDKRTGEVREIEPGGGWMLQGEISKAVQATRTAQAIWPGDRTRQTRWGAMSQTPSLTGGAIKALSMEPKPQKMLPADTGQWRELEAPAPVPAVVRMDDPQYAAVLATPTSLPMGADVATGQTVMLPIEQAPHVRVHGSTQSGKTNLLLTMAAYALRQSWHVVVMDRRRFKDWGAFSSHIERIDTKDVGAAVHALGRLLALHEERDRMLGAAGAANVSGLPGERRIMVIVSETGSLFDRARAENMHGALTEPLSMLLRESGATGIHFAFEDQAPQGWPRPVVANATPIAGQMPLNYSSLAGYYDAHKLKPYQFHHNGIIFRSWDMTVAGPALLAEAPRLSAFRVVPSGTTMPPASSPQAQRTPNAPVSAQDGRWQDFVDGWVSDNPAYISEPYGAIAALARAMAAQDGRPDDWESYKSTAKGYWDRFMADWTVALEHTTKD